MIVELYGLRTVTKKDDAIALAPAEHADQDMRYETQRARVLAKRCTGPPREARPKACGG